MRPGGAKERRILCQCCGAHSLSQVQYDGAYAGANNDIFPRPSAKEIETIPSNRGVSIREPPARARVPPHQSAPSMRLLKRRAPFDTLLIIRNNPRSLHITFSGVSQLIVRCSALFAFISHFFWTQTFPSASYFRSRLGQEEGGRVGGRAGMALRANIFLWHLFSHSERATATRQPPPPPSTPSS